MCQLVVDLNFELMYWFRHLYFSIVIFYFKVLLIYLFITECISPLKLLLLLFFIIFYSLFLGRKGMCNMPFEVKSLRNRTELQKWIAILSILHNTERITIAILGPVYWNIQFLANSTPTCSRSWHTWFHCMQNVFNHFMWVSFHHVLFFYYFAHTIFMEKRPVWNNIASLVSGYMC